MHSLLNAAAIAFRNLAEWNCCPQKKEIAVIRQVRVQPRDALGRFMKKERVRI